MPDIFVAPDYTEKKKARLRAKPHGVGHEGKVMASHRQTVNPLSAFMVRPRLRFETQEPEEQVLMVLRRHLLTNIPWVVIALVGWFLPVGIMLIPFWATVPLPFRLVTIVVWYLVVIGYMFEGFLTWYFNVFIITDQRIVDIDFFSLIYKKMSTTKFDRVEDISFTLSGLLGVIFDFGRVDVQTAGELPNFDLRDIPHPQIVTQFLGEMQAKAGQLQKRTR